MEDLLNEDDFKLTYNPWPRFKRYYMYATISLFVWLLASLIVMNLIEDNFITPVGYILSPFIVSWMMFFRKTENALLPYFTIVKSLFFVTSIYFIPLVLLFFFSSEVLAALVVWLVLTIIIITPPVLSSISKKKKIPTGASTGSM